MPTQTGDVGDLTILSSGIEAERDQSGPIVPFVRVLQQDDGLLQYTGTTWTQTTQTMIDASDLLVFMNVDVYEDAMKWYEVPLAKSQVWQIPDVQGASGQIRSAVDALLSQLDIGSHP